MKHLLLFEEFSNSFPKNLYVNLNHKDLEEYEDEIFDLIQNAYAQKGGNLEIRKPHDLDHTDLDYWVAMDMDSDPYADIALGGKNKPYGTKITVIAQDGGKEAKHETVRKMIELMKTRGFYAELDMDLANKFGLKPIEDEKEIKKVIGKPDIEYIGRGIYTRSIAGHKKEKVLVGIPKK
jgi:hypothetical protein